MAIDICDPCNDPCVRNQVGSPNQTELFRRAIFEILCGLSSNIPGVSQTVALEQVGITASNLNLGFAAYADAGLLDTTGKLRKLRVLNTTDVDINISLDGGATTFMKVLAGTQTDQLDLGNYIAASPTDFQIRIASGSATTGNLYIEGLY